MKKILWTLLLISTLAAASEVIVAPLSQKQLYGDRDVEFQRGTYLVVLANSYLEAFLVSPAGGNFVEFKMTQGYDVDIVSLDTAGLSDSDPDALKLYIEEYYSQNPMLEYVLFVGDVSGPFTIPCFYVPSINEDELDVTDYPYSYFQNDPGVEGYDVLEPRFLVGRWPVRSTTDMLMAKMKSIQYVTMDSLVNGGTAITYLDSALLVAGNYSNNDGQEIPPENWPVTPVWTSRWLHTLLENYGFAEIDTAYYYAEHQIEINPTVWNAWNAGRGFVTYRGWGNSHGWHYPEFHIDDLGLLSNGWKLPIVFSLVCNTGDFGSQVTAGFGETLLFMGTPSSGGGGAAVIGPSDLDTDTRYNNVIFIAMWDALLEGRAYELAAALHAGKQGLVSEFPQLMDHGDVVEFYHHVYSVIGDPSMPVRLLTPGVLSIGTEGGFDTDLYSSFVSGTVVDEYGSPVEDVVGSLIHQGQIIGKGLSTPDGYLGIDFDGVADGSELTLYLNSPQFQQVAVDLTFISDDGSHFEPEIWTAFDVTPILSTGDVFLESGSDVSISLTISNGSPHDFENVMVHIHPISEGSLTGGFADDIISIDAFTAMQTDVMFAGTVNYLAVGDQVRLGVDFSIDGTPIAESAFELMVGPVAESDPVPPCDYGYWAFDNTDVDYADAPAYEWVEIAEVGYDLGLTDDTVVHEIPIGFPFTYYGENYESVTVCSNGWLSFVDEEIPYFWNFSIPMSGGAAGMIAPFNDDLDDNNGEEPFNVYAFTDDENGRFIIQWDNVANGEDDEFCPVCVRETFQVILYDPAMHETATGDGEIVFQYQEIHDLDENGNYSTIGIESPDQNTGVQYLFNDNLAPGAAPLADGLAIKFTTTAPPACLPGDLTGDGSLDILDIVAMVNLVIISHELTDDELCTHDPSGDGNLDILDIVYVVQVIVGP